MDVDWGRLTPRLREGDWTCATHGLITPRVDTLVPACPHCGAMALRAVRERGRPYLVHTEPSPVRCANGHPYAPHRVQLGWHACHCPPVAAAGGNGHRTWRCVVCGDMQAWPPCTQQP